MSRDLTMVEAANYVLHECGEPGRWVPPGGFYQLLIAAAMRADPENLRKIGAGFPNIANAVHVYKFIGPELLKTAAAHAAP